MSAGQIAALVAAGHSNKQVASELFVSVNTVEGALKKIYAASRGPEFEAYRAPER